MPRMDQLERLYLSFVLSLMLAVVLMVMMRHWIRKLRVWMDRHGWIKYHYEGDPATPAYRTIGIAALALQQLIEPQKAHVLELKTEEETEQDDEGGPDRAGRRRRRHRRRRSRRSRGSLGGGGPDTRRPPVLL